ncbi:Odorant receptor [Homalodisca vitripennis]|nr:Odorant receptor [Homalodisca vitripennis]
MHLSPYIEYFPLIIRAGTTFNYRTGQFCCPLLAWVVISCLAVIASNTVIVAKEGISNEILNGQSYETFIFIFLILNIPVMIRNKDNIPEIIQLLLKPFGEASVVSRYSVIVQNYKKWINIFGHVVIFNNFFVISCVTMVLGPLLTLPFKGLKAQIQEMPLPVGRITFYSESYAVYAVAYLVSATAITSVCAFYASWYLAMIYSSLKIKAMIQLLIENLKELDSRAEMHCFSTLDISQRRLTGREKAILLQKITAELLHEAIRDHIEIISYTKIVDRTFRQSLLLFIQLAVIICALLVHQMMTMKNQTIQDYLVKGNITFAALFSMGVFSYCCQSIITESNNLHRALFACNWVNKPIEFKRSLLVMMTVATRPLRVTAGGVKPLSMASYRYLKTVADILSSLAKRRFTDF